MSNYVCNGFPLYLISILTLTPKCSVTPRPCSPRTPKDRLSSRKIRTLYLYFIFTCWENIKPKGDYNSYRHYLSDNIVPYDSLIRTFREMGLLRGNYCRLTSSGRGQISAVFMYSPSTTMNLLVTLALRGFYSKTNTKQSYFLFPLITTAHSPILDI